MEKDLWVPEIGHGKKRDMNRGAEGFLGAGAVIIYNVLI